MATPTFNVFEDDATFDVIWRRISDDDEEQTGPGERDDDGIFQLKRAPQPASSFTTQNPSTSSIPMIATFIWEDSEVAKFCCEYNHTSYNHTSRSYDHFALVEGSMSEDFGTALAMANGMYTEPDLDEVEEGIWKLRMYTMYSGRNPQQVELWAKKRVDDVQAEATDSDLRNLSLGRYASGNEGEDEEEDPWGEEEEQDAEEEDGAEKVEEGEEEKKEKAEEEDEEEEEEEEGEEEAEEHSDA